MSLQKYWAMQNEEIALLEAELVALQSAVHAELEEGRKEVEAVGDTAGAALLKIAPGGLEAPLIGTQLDGVWQAIEGAFRSAECEDCADLLTKGCSTSTVRHFLSCLDSRLDEIEIVATRMKDGITDDTKQRSVCCAPPIPSRSWNMHPSAAALKKRQSLIHPASHACRNRCSS